MCILEKERAEHVSGSGLCFFFLLDANYDNYIYIYIYMYMYIFFD